MHTPADYQKLLDVALATFAADYTICWLQPHIEDDAWAAKHPGYSGHYYQNSEKLTFNLPRPETASCLFIALHELGHKVLIDQGLDDILGLIGSREFCASLWAKGYMAAHNIPVPPAIWATALANAQTH